MTKSEERKVGRIGIKIIRIHNGNLTDQYSNILSIDNGNQAALDCIDWGNIKYEIDKDLPKGFYCSIED